MKGKVLLGLYIIMASIIFLVFFFLTKVFTCTVHESSEPSSLSNEVPYVWKFSRYIIFANFANEAAFGEIKYRGNFAVKRKH